jgi:hypothetical protein
MTAPTPQQKLVDATLHRASLDAAFRRDLLADPARAIHDVFGVQLPAGIRIRFLDRDPAWDAEYLLPPLRQGEDELSEKELEAVAGGQDAYAWDHGGPPG